MYSVYNNSSESPRTCLNEARELGQDTDSSATSGSTA
eukprot:XP_001705745.1 Hypothetical protein GL50803_24256 [Giardia lamblia ATCC 50803]